MRFVLLISAAIPSSVAFHPSLVRKSTAIRSSNNYDTNEWSVADNWDALSSQNPQNSDAFKTMIQDQYYREYTPKDQPEPTPEEAWLNDAMNFIQTEPKTDDIDVHTYVDDMGREIALLVRCNKSPQDLLVEEGRVLLPLTDEEKYDVSQLLTVSSTSDSDSVQFTATPFLTDAVKKIYSRYAKLQQDVTVMDAQCVARWMQQCSESKALVGPHEPRVRRIISRHSDYGTGYLTLDNLQNYYMDALVGDHSCKSLAQLQRTNKDSIMIVWKDLGYHNIESPSVAARSREEKEQNIVSSSHTSSDKSIGSLIDQVAESEIMDECEIIEEKIISWKETENGTWKREGKSSHEYVEMSYDKKTPLYMKDGDYVFIDEESCIGCMQCVNVAPGSFSLAEDGRARTFAQKKTPEVTTAVETCPVACMHYVGFEKLKELELARDSVDGDGRSDHRHFGKKQQGGWYSRIPLHVSGLDSDANHKSSWYHYLTHKCFRSSECPQKGCYDCPHYRNDPESNPNLIRRMQETIHTRATHFIGSGIADVHRKTAEL